MDHRWLCSREAGDHQPAPRPDPTVLKTPRVLHLSHSPKCVKNPRTRTFSLSLLSLSLSLNLSGITQLGLLLQKCWLGSLPIASSRSVKLSVRFLSFSFSVSRIFPLVFHSPKRSLIAFPFPAAFAILLHCPKLREFSFKFRLSILHFNPYVFDS